MGTVAFVLHEVDFIENMGIPFLSAVAQQQGWHVELFVYRQATIDADMRRVRPDVVAYSVMSPNAATFLSINRQLKSRYSFVSIMGGPHPTFFPDVRFEDGVDYICRGEGEQAFASFLSCLDQGQAPDDIANLGSRHFLNPLGALVADLDTLPMPDRDLVFGRTELGRSKLKLFSQSRGCPFSCTYCFNNPLNEMQRGLGKSYRFFSPERVCAEINQVRARYPLTFVKFQDDLFLPKTEWLEHFGRVYKREVGLPFYALERLDLMDEERCRILADCGCRSLGFAIDSANIAVRKGMLGRAMHLTNDEIVDRLSMVRRHGIYTLTGFMQGVPTMTAEDERLGTELNAQGRVTYGMSSILVTYPGTAVYRHCVEHGLLTGPASGNPQDSADFSSIQKRSILNCYTEAEKDLQFNLATLYPLMSSFPRLRWALYWLARRLPPNRAFVWVAILWKGFVLDRYIYPTGESVLAKLRLFLKARRIETQRMAIDDPVRLSVTSEAAA
jgi:hypothetical protein